MSLPTDHAARIDRARRSLDGLSVGDAFGDRFFTSLTDVATWLSERQLPIGWPWGQRRSAWASDSHPLAPDRVVA